MSNNVIPFTPKEDITFEEAMKNHDEQIKKETDEYLSNLKEDVNSVKNVINYSNNDNSKNGEDLEEKEVVVTINPITGENIIANEYDEDFEKSFENMINRINSGDDILFGDKPITEKDAVDYLSTADDEIMLAKLAEGTDLSNDDIKTIMNIIKRRDNREKVNVYKELPESIRKGIDDFVSNSAGFNGVYTTSQMNAARKALAEQTIDEFVDSIKVTKAKTDFAIQLQNIYDKANIELQEAGLNYTEERNAAYREAADKIEDEEKKSKLKAILDRIDEARSLSQLKEFAKTCKIKSIELEKADSRIFSSFLSKYKNSTNNIYDISLARQVLFRHIMKKNPNYGIVETTAFLVAFCKQVNSYSVDNSLDHAYMYYVLYYCVMMDADKSDIFINNVIDVIENLKERNPTLLKD